MTEVRPRYVLARTLHAIVLVAAVVVATHDRRMRADLSDWPELTLG